MHALAALQSEAAQRREAAAGGDVAAVARGSFLRPDQRLLLFMGGLRPSAVLAVASAQARAPNSKSPGRALVPAAAA